MNYEKIILVFALRYALGRNTGAPLVVCDSIKDKIHLFNENDCKELIEEIDQYYSFYNNEIMNSEWIDLKSFLSNVKSTH